MSRTYGQSSRIVHRQFVIKEVKRSNLYFLCIFLVKKILLFMVCLTNLCSIFCIVNLMSLMRLSLSYKNLFYHDEERVEMKNKSDLIGIRAIIYCVCHLQGFMKEVSLVQGLCIVQLVVHFFRVQKHQLFVAIGSTYEVL